MRSRHWRSMDAIPLAPIYVMGEIADLLVRLREAADAGDSEAEAFLHGFDPWAQVRLASQPRH